MRADKTLLVLAFILMLLASRVSAQQPGRILYVNGADGTCGGLSPCYRTIQAAVDAAVSRDTIRIQVGTYGEQVTIQKNDFTTASESDRILIEADPDAAQGSVVLTGSPGLQCTDKFAIRIKQSKFITIRGLTITGTGGQAVSIMGGNNGNVSIHLELNRIFGNGSSSCNGGITVARGNPGTLIVNNLIYANGRNGITFIDTDGGPHYVINNTIYGNEWNGVDVARNHTITLANNIIHNNGTASGTTGGRHGVRRESSTTPQPAGIKLLNNLVCGNTQGQISAQVLDSTDSSNYTPLGSEGTGVGALPGCELRGNLFGDVNGSDNLPNTVDDDFSLKANSLGIDIGMDPRTLGFNPFFNPIFEADFVIEGIRPADGNADRVHAFDAGAFEFPNAPPVANPGPNQRLTTNQLVSLNGSQSNDPEGAALAFQWTIVSQPAGSSITLNGANTANPTFTALVAGQYIFQLIVNDGQFASAPSTVTISAATANHSPVLSPVGNRTVTVGSTLTFTVTATDLDNDPLTYLVSPLPLPATASFNPSTRVFNFTPTASQAGSFNLTFAVNDGRGGTASETITITVTNGLSISITSPNNGATVSAGQMTVRGNVRATGGAVGVTVNGIPAAVQGNTFTVLIYVRPDTISVTATATTGTGTPVSQTVGIAVVESANSFVSLRAIPFSGPAPLVVNFTLLSEAALTQVSLDANGDGIVDYNGPQLDQLQFTFTQPGVYLATATVTTTQGSQANASALIEVFDAAQLDVVLRAKWASMKDALRMGDIDTALNEIAQRARSRYEEGFRILSAQLPNIDQILTDISFVELRENEAIYDATRIDDALPMAFEVRFVIDGDGVWRIRSF